MPIGVFQHCLDCDEKLINLSLKDLFENEVLNWEIINDGDQGKVIRFSVIEKTPKIEINELIESITRMKQVSEELSSVNYVLTQTSEISVDAVEDKMDARFDKMNYL